KVISTAGMEERNRAAVIRMTATATNNRSQASQNNFRATRPSKPDKACNRSSIARPPNSALLAHAISFIRSPRTTERKTIVPIHSEEPPRWLLKKIIREAGFTEDEFRQLL